MTSSPVRLYTSATVLAGFATLATGLMPWHSDNLARFLCYLAMAAVASGFQVRVPGITGTISPIFFFVLICVTTLSLPEALAVACAGTVVQSVWRSPHQPKLSQVLFNMASISLATTATSYWYHLDVFAHWGFKRPLMLVLAACVYFLTNTLPVAAIEALTKRRNLIKIWRECFFWTFPYYLVAAPVAGLCALMNRVVGWQTTLVILPALYGIYRSYALYLGRLEGENSHVKDMAGLHLRTIEALALAIEAKDSNSHEHLRRVGIYAKELGKELGLSKPERQALEAAALLHDIGKLAVPENISSKPGKLTAVEFEKVKIHPLIGAKILERVAFPYPVAPIVHAHHEKWDGTGYPSGLKGEEIPIGARILSAVDCFDAMTTDRRDRGAVSRESALAYIVAESGKSFDPKVVEILARRHQELEALVGPVPEHASPLSTHLKIARGSAPGAGFESGDHMVAAAGPGPDFLTSIAGARHEAQSLFELAHELGNSLSLDETLSVLAVRLKRMCRYDCIAIYVLRDNVLTPEYADGENFQLLSSLRIPYGEGLSGWVAENKRAIVNGNPAVEPGCPEDRARFSKLQSALAVPLEGSTGVVGVLTLYAAAPDAFTSDHLRMLSAVTTKIALSIENALKYRHAESCAITDALTDLPNARSLFVHLDSELARAKRKGCAVSVLVCDLDGFKQVNDRYGHIAGNKVLRRVAQALRENCREYDYVARMGGDEFVVVLPAYPIEIVKAKSRMLAEVAGRAAQDVTGEVVLSLSIGGASYPADGADAEELLAEADRRMYKAKHAGTSGDLKRLERSLNTSLREHLDAVDSRRWHRIIANSRR